MALQADISASGGITVTGAYLRLGRAMVSKDRTTGLFSARADIHAFADEDAASGAPMIAGSVTVDDLDLEANGLAQLYDKLKQDLIDAGADPDSILDV